ncbi:hypothetical protein AB7303_17685 [Providencia rettgeri]
MSVINKPDLKIFAQDAKTGEVETFPDILRGWGITLDRTAGKPPLEWFNAIGKRVDEWLMYLTQRGVAEWDTTLSYPKTAIVQFNSVVYVSIKETKGEQPDKSQAAWSTLGVYLGLGNYYTKSESDTKIADAKKAGTDANNNANGRVPSTRTVNGKSLINDIMLTADDIGVYTKTEIDTKVTDAKKAGTDAQATANAANTAATNANNNANSRVPSTRKVNNKALSTDISLNAGDVGAYTKAEVDSKLAIGSGLGYGQTWQNLISSRSSGVTYTNATSKPIVVSVSKRGNGLITIAVDGVVISEDENWSFATAIIPPNTKYVVSVSGTITRWAELR